MALAVGDLRAIMVRTTIINGVLAQLVERLNGIEEVRGSNPLGSTISDGGVLRSRRFEPWFDYPRASASLGKANFVEPDAGGIIP
jgi:hypothetical protein